MRILLETISKTHPDLPSTIEDTKYKNCEDFLGNFEGIYTINYDLLLCWVINNSKTLPTKFNDGFGNRSDNNQDFVEWQLGDDIKANLLYLHGAMHILDNGAKAKKLTFNRTNIPLKEQISSYLRKKEYPIFVSGGRSEDKLEQIMHHGYLSRCYRSLQSIKSCLFIFGFAFKEND